MITLNRFLLPQSPTRLPFALLGVLLLFLIPSSASAVQSDEADFHQQDLDGDGEPDIAFVDAAFASMQDRISVIDQGGDMQWADFLDDAVDWDNDVWIYDVGQDGQADLIVAFESTPDGKRARIYDDYDGDGRVSHTLRGDQLVVTEGSLAGERRWVVQIESAGGWVLPDGTPNLNLTFRLDGRVPSALIWTLAQREQLLALDGNADWLVRVVDEDRDGIAESEVSRCLACSGNYGNLDRAWIKANVGLKPSLPLPSGARLPFLRGSDDLGTHNYFDYVPGAVVDWEMRRVTEVGVTGYPIETGYHIQSFEPLVENDVSNLDFENPQAYYDLAGDNDGYPELHIRLHLLHPGSRMGRSTLNTPLSEIRYSWNQFNQEGSDWDYKLGLAGRHEATGVVELQDFAIRTVPHAQFPDWVAGRPWDHATFVANEGVDRLAGSEGIYAWAPVFYASLYNNRPIPGEDGIFEDEAVAYFNRYYSGLASEAPRRFFHDILPGLRGEYNFNLSDRPYLYFSPIDRRLHLQGAEKGIWSLSGGDERIELDNLNEDPFLDQWQFVRDGDVVKTLFAHDGLIVLNTEETVFILRNEQPPALFTTSPPTNHEAWQDLKSQLQEASTPGPEQLFDQLPQRFPDVAAQVEGAFVQDFRITQQGFRFIMELEPGFHVQSDAGGLLSGVDVPDDYVIEFGSGDLSVRNLTAASLSNTTVEFGGDVPLYELEWTPVVVYLHNSGLGDLHNLKVCAVLTSPQDEREVLQHTVSTLPGSGSERVRWRWAPSTHGTWSIEVLTNCTADSQRESFTSLLASTHVDVLPSREQHSAIGSQSIFSEDEPKDLGYLIVVLTVFTALFFAIILSLRHMKQEGGRTL